MIKASRILQLVQWASIIFVLLTSVLVWIYSPFYSKMVLQLLNQFISFEVDQVAAQSQKIGVLAPQDSLEPGSQAWIARQAYLQVLTEALEQKDSSHLLLIQARYKSLQQLIQQQQKQLKAEEKPKVPLLSDSAASEALAPNLSDYLWKDPAQNALMQQYLVYLHEHPIDDVALQPIDQTIFLDIALLNQQKNEQAKLSNDQPYAIVVLGGGLTVAENNRDIVVNSYTRLRLEKTLEVLKQHPLPIVLSGVEAPYMQTWLKSYQVEAQLLEDRSMNTCENTRFSSLLLQKKGGAPTVILITDPYHMPRTRRLFALNGIKTIPIEAPMPTPLTAWQPSQQNYDHSRRANYEMLATIRDVLLGSSDCREVP